MHILCIGLVNPYGSDSKRETDEMVPCGLGHPMKYMPLWCAKSASFSVLIINLWPLLTEGVGGYNHLCIGEEVEWRRLLLYAYPLGHHVPADLKIPGKCKR